VVYTIVANNRTYIFLNKGDAMEAARLIFDLTGTIVGIQTT
jgi:hypothetical protein